MSVGVVPEPRDKAPAAAGSSALIVLYSDCQPPSASS
jgi:hypothetical protein